MLKVVVLILQLLFHEGFSQPKDFLRNFNLLRNFGPSVDQAINISSIKNAECRNDVQFWLNSLDYFTNAMSINCTNREKGCLEKKQQLVNRYLFAAKQIDSFGKIPTNVLSLKTVWMGSWDECLGVVSADNVNYQTKFCYVHLAVNIPVDIDYLSNLKGLKDPCLSPVLPRWSVCAPRSCSEEEITTLLRSSNQSRSLIKFCRTKCRPPTLPKLDFTFYIVMSIFLFLFILVVISTIFDYYTESERYKRYRDSAGSQCLLAFSIYTNGAEIMDVTKRPGRLYSLNCIRTVTLSWIMIGHIIALYMEGDNAITTLQQTVFILNDVFTSAYVAVDTFFFISGLLVAYIFFHTIHKNPKRLKSVTFWSLYYIHRYVRLSPPYFLFIAFVAVICNFVTYGPIEYNEMVSGDPCRTEWWRNVLYINKMYDNGGNCLPHTWYLAADMQMYIIAPFFLVLLYFSPLKFYLVAVVVIALTAAVNYVSYFKHDFPANYIGYFASIYDEKKRYNFDQLVYYAVWLRIPPYLIGIFTGYFLQRTQNKNLHLHWTFIVLLWIASILIALGCVYGLYDYYQGPSHAISTSASASYNYWSRVGWAMAIAWVVIACEKNWAGPIKNLMEQGFWIPFGRLTYCSYLTHGLMLPIIYSMIRYPIHLVSTHHAYITEAIPLFVTSTGTAFIWCVMFEMPFAKLETIAIKAILGDYLNRTAVPESKKLTQEKKALEVIKNNSDVLCEKTRPRGRRKVYRF